MRRWGDQFAEAIKYEGEDMLSFILFILSLPWTVIFALVPPPRIFGGWLCFITALVFIGLLTALISDLASQMGEGSLCAAEPPPSV